MTLVTNPNEWRKQAIEALGSEASIDFQFATDGEVFAVPHPLLLDDDRNEALDKSEGSVAMAKAILGDDQFDRFKAAGGRASDVLLAWRTVSKVADPKK